MFDAFYTSFTSLQNFFFFFFFFLVIVVVHFSDHFCTDHKLYRSVVVFSAVTNHKCAQLLALHTAGSSHKL